VKVQPMRILVIGADGLIGSALYDHLLYLGHTVFGTTRRAAQTKSRRRLMYLDLTEPRIATDHLPDADVAVICTAITSFAECRQQPELARLVNATAAALVARQLSNRGMFVVRLSSTAIFQNTSPMALPLQPPNSRTLYGRMQAEGEKLVFALGSPVSIVRFTKIVTPSFPLMTKWIATLVSGGAVEAFVDHGLCPVTLACSIDALTAVIESRRPGIYQVSASRDLSYAELAAYLVDQLGLPRDRVMHVRAIDKGMPAEEITPYSSLDSQTLTELAGFAQADPYAVLHEVFGPAIKQARAQIAQKPTSTGDSM
jgi:dTDP-4-dehydrorhamnose reductase